MMAVPSFANCSVPESLSAKLKNTRARLRREDRIFFAKAGGAFVVVPAIGYKILEITNVPERGTEQEAYDYRYAKKGGVRLNSRKLGEALATIAKSNHARIEPLSERYPEMMEYLSGDRSLDYRTGKEDALRSWVLSQPDNSITVESIFAEALRLNQNQIGEALLTTHELLRNEARYFTNYVHYPSTPQKKKIFFDKFTDIRGDLVESGGRGDHPGSWYRLFGMLTWIYSKGVVRSATLPSTWSNHLIWSEGIFVATSAEALKPIIRWPERDTGKAQFNRFAVSTGYSLIQMLADRAASTTPQRQP